MAEDSETANFHRQYDRQIRLWGLAAQQRMSGAQVLVCGMRGLAAEVCKNIVLAGVGNVALMDSALVIEEDLGGQFFLGEEDVGKHSRAEASVAGLQALNPLAKVTACKGDVDSLDDASIKQYDVVCMTASSVSAQRRVGALCRKHKKKFISADAHGFFAIMWLDLLEHSYMSEETNEKNETVKTIGTISYPAYEDAASFDWTQLLIDQETKKKNQTVGPAFYAIKAVHAAHDKSNSFLSDGDDAMVEQVTKELCATHKCDPKVFDSELIKLVGSQGEYQLSITCSIFGGMVADTIVRAITGREKPIVNCLVFDGRVDGTGFVLKVGEVLENETTEKGSLEE
mmetsp:Transcript_56173/g.90944  ORF Transcript_56173/g.90944 Transcript_56173/m.90944 type:complete len:342 (+) Transcript_56173:3-1028(+)